MEIASIRSYLSVKRVLGFVLIVLPFLNTIFDWIGRLETAKNIPGYLVEFSHWFSAHQDWIIPVFVLVGVFLIVWDERKLIDVRVAHLQGQLDQLALHLGGKIINVNNTVTALNQSQNAAAARTTLDLNAVAFLEYLDRNRLILKIATDAFYEAWGRFEALIMDTNVDWVTHSPGLAGGVSRPYAEWNDLYHHVLEKFDAVKLIAITSFGYNWNESPEYKEDLVWPDASHLPIESLKTQYKRAWIEHERSKFQIRKFQEYIDNQTIQALDSLKRQAIPFRALQPRQGIPMR